MASTKASLTDEEKHFLGGIGDLFREMREEAGITQREAASRLNSIQARCSSLETGRADMMMTTLYRWAEIYGYRLEIGVTPIGKPPELGDYRLWNNGLEKYDGTNWVPETPIEGDVV